MATQALHRDGAQESLAPALPRKPPQPAARSAPWLTLVLIVGSYAGVVFYPPAASAQGRTQPVTLAVTSQLLLKPGVETPLEVRAIPSEAVPPQAVIVIRGVPPGLRFSEGRAFGQNVWVLPASRLAHLKLQAPSDTSSGGLLTIGLTTLDGTSIAEAKVTVLSMPEAKETVGTTATLSLGHESALSSPSPESEQRIPSLPPLENRVELLLLLEKGKESLRIGNILIARQFYERAASKGLAEAALALASTYDPRELTRMKTVGGIAPDLTLARKWYAKAVELGSMDAAARLSELGRP